MTRGFLLGKFLPPHLGHVFLCEFARSYADQVTILVCSLDREPIPGSLRSAWMREMFPWARILHCEEEAPQEPHEHADFWNIWRGIVKRHHPEPIDFVFASEDYGVRLAAEVGARFVPVDPGRLAVPISGTKIRDNPFASWRYLPPPIRAYYAKTVCLFGPESTGKTTLAHDLARQFDTVAVPEYGRTYTDTFGTECAADDLMRIARGHEASVQATLRTANRVAILDTDAVLTCVWAEMLLGKRLGELESVRPSDFYLLTGIDIPWADDGTRYFSDGETRRMFFDRCRSELERRRLPYVTLEGTHDERLRAALAAIRNRYPALAALQIPRHP